MHSLKTIIDHLPHAPGVYHFLNEGGEVLYVGKAIDLKKRVGSYFRNQKGISLRLQKLVEKIANIEVTVVNSELEALILETNLIKSYRPRYNVLMKDDKNYMYLKITINEPFPRILITRQIEKDGARYFGPKTSAAALKRTLHILKKIFPYRHCGLDIVFEGEDHRGLRSGKPGEGGGPFKVLVSNKVIKYPCIDYHIKRCIGPCVGTVNPEEYAKIIDQVIHFFEGKTDVLLNDLKAKMMEAAAAKQFEKAGLLRDRYQAIESLMEPQRITSTDHASRDVIGISIVGGSAYVTLFLIRDGKLKGQENFVLNALDVDSGVELENAEVLEAFVKQYYEKALDLPKEVLFPEPLESTSLLEDWILALANHSLRLVFPQKGKSRDLLRLAEENAQIFAKQSQVRWQAFSGKNIDTVLKDLQKILHLPKIPNRIECYDISHLGGTDTVGSMVVFEKGLPKKSDYRHFKLRSVQERIDDYQAMHEVLARRFRYLKAVSTDLRKPKKSELQNIVVLLSQEGFDAETLNPHQMLIAEKGKKIVACARLKPTEKDVFQLTSFWVHPKHRGQGLGKELIFTLLKNVKKGKVYTFSCSDRVDWYGALGFHEAKEVPHFLTTPESRPICMVYRVQKGDVDVSFSRKPHLLVIDGGKGQLHVAVKALEEARLKIPVLGLAKREEEIFLPGESAPLVLGRDVPELQLLQRLRDEAHRFALKYQHHLRGKRMVS